MRSPASAYEILGLAPGADRIAVEEAYRRLIKRYHPDRSGGDAKRAAEINQAYFELRREPHFDPQSASFEVEPRAAAKRQFRSRRARPPNRGGVRGSRWLPLVLALLAGWALIERERLAELMSHWADALAAVQSPVGASAGGGTVRLDTSAVDGPLEEAAISDSINQVLELAGRGDEHGLAQRSRECHRRLRSKPELEMLDRCAAFDDAAAVISDRMASSDRGTFSPSAVTARQMTAASLLSNDYLANERRLDRIRTMVELTIVPRPPPLPPVAPVEDEAPAAPAEAGRTPVEI